MRVAAKLAADIASEGILESLTKRLAKIVGDRLGELDCCLIKGMVNGCVPGNTILNPADCTEQLVQNHAVAASVA